MQAVNVISLRLLTVHHPTGQTARGTLRESTPNERIVFGWGYDATDTSTVTIQLTPTAAGTTGTQRSDHAQGWTHYLGQLSGGAANMGFVAALPGAVAEYIKAWDETDIAASAGQLEACWEDDAALRDSTGVAAGREALPHYITNAWKIVRVPRMRAPGYLRGARRQRDGAGNELRAACGHGPVFVGDWVLG